MRAAALERQRQELAGKLTGKQLFMRDQSLNDSDVKFLEAGESHIPFHFMLNHPHKGTHELSAGETVKVDESLFEDLDDLDLDDEDEDDPDWRPGQAAAAGDVSD